MNHELKLEQGAYYWAQMFADSNWQLFHCTCDTDNLLMDEYTRKEYPATFLHRIYLKPVKQPQS